MLVNDFNIQMKLFQSKFLPLKYLLWLINTTLAGTFEGLSMHSPQFPSTQNMFSFQP
jgi:hypothetical protein